MFKKVIFPMFLFNSHEGGLTDRNLTPSGDEASPIVQKKRSLLALTGEEQPRYGWVIINFSAAVAHMGGSLAVSPTESQSSIAGGHGGITALRRVKSRSYHNRQTEPPKSRSKAGQKNAGYLNR
jgi:hypothetical protein